MIHNEDCRRFMSRLRAIRFIDRHTLDDAGYCLTDEEWASFRKSSYGFLILSGEVFQLAVFKLITERER